MENQNEIKDIEDEETQVQIPLNNLMSGAPPQKENIHQ